MIPVPNAVRVAMKYNVEGLTMYNIINVLQSSPASAGDLSAIAAVFQAWWETEWRATLSGSLVWLQADLTALDSSGSPVLTHVNSGSATGGLGGGVYPPNVSIAISLKTGLSGRSYRGRIYMPCVQPGFAVSGGRITTGAVAFIQPKVDALRTRLIASGRSLCVVSLYSGVDGSGNRIPRTVGVATPVTSISVGTRIDSQRRRLPSGE